jgi:uncharacterized protein
MIGSGLVIMRSQRAVESLYIVGLISDTHGLMRKEALEALQGSNLIIHCGDIGKPTVLAALKGIAPVRAVRGNNDNEEWARGLPARNLVNAGGHAIYVLHSLAELGLNPADCGFSAIVSGHSHKPVIKAAGKVLLVNPGSAGPRRFALPVSVGRLVLRPGGCDAEIIELLHH